MSLKQGFAMTIVMIFLLSGCGGASATPSGPAEVIELSPRPPSPPPVQPRPPTVPPTATTIPTNTPDGTVTVEPSPTLEAPIDRPFLMKIDRISVIVGRGTLLEGRVANGSLIGGGSVDILGLGKDIIRPTLLAILISNRVRDIITVGDYAGVLVGGIQPTDLSPGMLLAEAGKFESYEEALLQLR